VNPFSLRHATGSAWLTKQVGAALAEDLGDAGDITSLATLPENRQGFAELIAKSDGVIAGIDWAVETGAQLNPPANWVFSVADGERVQSGQRLAEVTGPLRSILISERTALNGVGHLSGIATQTAVAVQLLEGTNAQVYDTRKTMPGWRNAQKYAVRCGGGENHRIGLFDEILLKENHLRPCGGVAAGVRKAQEWRQLHNPSIPIESEVTSLQELEEALIAKPDRILLDNFTFEMMRQAVRITAGRIPLEASGGITLENLQEVASTGVERISLGALTHSVKPLDLSLLVRETRLT